MLPIEKPTKTQAFNAGRDCGLNGTNTTNCHFSLFHCKENAKAWEAGKRAGESMRSHGVEPLQAN